MFIACFSVATVSLGLAVLLTVRWMYAIQKEIIELRRRRIPQSGIVPQKRYTI